MDTMKLTGRIKWINESKGISLITPDRGGKDVFANVPVRRGNAPAGGLLVSQRVTYDLKVGRDGDEAFNVKVVRD